MGSPERVGYGAGSDRYSRGTYKGLEAKQNHPDRKVDVSVLFVSRVMFCCLRFSISMAEGETWGNPNSSAFEPRLFSRKALSFTMSFTVSLGFGTPSRLLAWMGKGKNKWRTGSKTLTKREI